MFNGEKIERYHEVVGGRGPGMVESNSLLKEPGREPGYVFSRVRDGGEKI